MDIKQKLIDVVATLNELDNYLEEIPEKQSKIDLAISDLYHYIENNTLNSKSSYRVVKELKTILQERRKLKQEQDLLRTYNIHRNKLTQIDNRGLLLSEVNKTEKIVNLPYKNRIYDEEELKTKLEA